MDLISALQDDLIETILIKLPLRDAARTCILSRRWRDSWVKIPHLKLDVTFWQKSLQNQSQSRVTKFESILFRILLVHQGPITNITLHIPKLESPPDIDMFVTSVVKNGVQSFYLDNVPGGHYKVHSSLFTCLTLKYLDLRYCEVNFLPSAFIRLSNLATLILVDVTISAQALKCLVSSCPNLHNLQLVLSIDIQCLEIVAPKLGVFLYVHLKIIQNSHAVNYGQQQQSIIGLLGGFPDLKSLVLDSYSLKHLDAGGFPRRFPSNILQFLNILKLAYICLEDGDQFSSVLGLIRISPNLQKVQVKGSGSKVNSNNMENLQDEDYCDITLNNLVDVEMLSVVGGMLELKFIKILLEKSPSLRKMNIGLATSEIDGLRIIKQICMFRRVAPNVEVLFKE